MLVPTGRSSRASIPSRALRLSGFPQELAGAVQAHPRRPRPPARAAGALQAGGQANRSGSTEAAITGPVWDPIRPFLGFGDWLERVTWLGGNGMKGQGARASRALAWFRPERNGSWTLKKTHRDDPVKRLELVECLLKAVPAEPKGSRTTRPSAPCSSTSVGNSSGSVEKTLWPSEQKAVMRGLKCPLYSYQRDGVKRFLETGRLLLADDMGLGKTAQAIACCDILWRTGRVRRGLIIAPASLKPQWAREWAHFSDLPIEVIDGNPTERQSSTPLARKASSSSTTSN